ncbi:predicted protein [Sclerotinia sclerotiorum 1980 UF-70]|uniref:Uncharacterized protein n=1 Tax=Sclerotinia sclerotiorum (strain ATCC 18683 / 1980 / Ss-1) TaxID=665079 RepID=A7E7R7_SCLS1|nr:predicted protein [Sclerotinia sclerotiorum 1980 UF-70]EDN96419.1 predicted protein [Sclerotinia sclerotiorum 1980 UF-70]
MLFTKQVATNTSGFFNGTLDYAVDLCKLSPTTTTGAPTTTTTTMHY